MSKPNIILMMCDDLGYGDTGFNGNPIIRTPFLDQMAQEGAAFTRFHSGAPVCSPTRGTCLTGRHHYRYGITTANNGRLPREEITLAKALRSLGYATGHFGKWHLGTLTTEIRDGRRGGPAHPELYSPPWEHGFERCFSTEVQVPLWDPMVNQKFPCKYWHEDGSFAETNLAGDDSRVIMDRVIPFIENAAAADKPFFAVVWFHAPHADVVAGDEYRQLYSENSEDEQHYYGCITAMDEQVGRLNRMLKSSGLEQNTVIWFCSDNGPEGKEGNLSGRNRGSTGGLRGRKRSLFNGGITVPALVKWPEYIQPGTTLDLPCSTLDFFPTLTAATGYEMPDSRPLDGVDLLPYFQGEMTRRPKPIPYRFVSSKSGMAGSPTFGVIDNEWKLLTNFSGDGTDDMVFNVVEDPYEQHNLIDEQRTFALNRKEWLHDLLDHFMRSHYGGDYDDEAKYEPVNEFICNEQTWTEE
ncbi:MAG: Sulfatase, family [Paenibacillaceae bacterium]|jgi:arylsulfatase A-like enzyme|nr:Sulfatase, family [Paenibacillaceae bacterium]